MEFSINCGGLTDERRASAGASAGASGSASANAGVPAGASFGGVVMTNSAGITTTTNATATHLTTNHGSKDSRGKQPMAGVGASLANVLTDPSPPPPPPHNYPYDIKKIRVCVVAESSDVASSIPG